MWLPGNRLAFNVWQQVYNQVNFSPAGVPFSIKLGAITSALDFYNAGGRRVEILEKVGVLFHLTYHKD